MNNNNNNNNKTELNSLCIEIQRTRKIKLTIIPVIIGATGIVTKGLSRNLEAVPGEHMINSVH
jgi:hypothetical protein